MDTLNARPEESAHAEALFAEWLERHEQSDAIAFEDWVRAHPTLETLLRALHDDWRFFAPFLGALAPGLLVDEQGVVVPSFSRGANAASEAPSQELLERLGVRAPIDTRYRFRGVLGHGGEGVVINVWDTKLGRALAMKVAVGRPGAGRAEPKLDGRRLARFVDEARIASQLNHPGIVPVHELGVDDAGRAYYTMKLVKGEDFSAGLAHLRAGETGWTQARALEVLLRVCDAMAYAHDRGVIHRDLKPSNVMVGPYGEVQVMDWGLARVSGARGSTSAIGPTREAEIDSVRSELRREEPLSPLQTLAGHALGTPAFMAPEQARGELALVDSRSDVYSVGAMLYELLAGAPPYAEHGVIRAPEGLLDAVREGPPKSIAKLAPQAPRELVAICERAMERDPQDRYASMQKLGDDLRAFVEGRVVQAHESGAWAEARKWMERNRWLAAALAVVVLGSLAAGITFALQASELRRTARVATENETSARVERERSVRNLALIRRTLASGDPNQGGEQGLTVVDAMERALEEMGGGALDDDPQAKGELLTTIAAIFDGNGQPERALTIARSAVDTLRLRPSLDDVGLAAAHHAVGASLHSLARFEESRMEFESALALERAHGRGQQDEAAVYMNGIGSCLLGISRPAEALEQFQGALDIQRAVLREPSDDMVANLNGLGLCEAALGRRSEAHDWCRQALEMSRSIHSSDHPFVASALGNLASSLQELGDEEEALQYATESAEMLQRVFHGDNLKTAIALANQASCLLRVERPREGFDTCEEALEMWRQLGLKEHPDWARALTVSAECAGAMGAVPLKIERLQQVLDMRTSLHGLDHLDVAQSERDLGIAYALIGDNDGAAEHLEEALRVRRALLDSDSLPTADCLINLAIVYGRTAKADESLLLAKEAVAIRRKAFAGDNPLLAESLNALAGAWHGARRFAEAFETAEEASAMHLRLGLGDSANCALAFNSQGCALYEVGRFAESVTVFERALAIHSKLAPDGDAESMQLHDSIANARFSQKEFAQSFEHADKSIALRSKLRQDRTAPAALIVHLRARCLLELGRIDEARRDAEFADELMSQTMAPDDPNHESLRKTLLRLRGL